MLHLYLWLCNTESERGGRADDDDDEKQRQEPQKAGTVDGSGTSPVPQWSPVVEKKEEEEERKVAPFRTRLDVSGSSSTGDLFR